MKKIVIVALLLISQLAYAGRIKDLAIEAMDSIISVTGFSEEVLEIESQQFIQVQDADLAIETVIKNTYLREAYTCLTKFNKEGQKYSLQETICYEK